MKNAKQTISLLFVKDWRWEKLGLFAEFKQSPESFLYSCRLNDLVSRHYYTFQDKFGEEFDFLKVQKDLESELGKDSVEKLLNLKLQEDINAISESCIEAYQYCQTYGYGHKPQIDYMACNLGNLISQGYIAVDKNLHPELSHLQNKDNRFKRTLGTPPL